MQERQSTTIQLRWFWRAGLAAGIGLALDFVIVPFILEPLVVFVPALHRSWLWDQSLEILVSAAALVGVYGLLTRYFGPRGGRHQAQLRTELGFLFKALGPARCLAVAILCSLALAMALTIPRSFNWRSNCAPRVHATIEAGGGHFELAYGQGG
jgi:hypothetical protein